jgi:AraC-like DNA-binding protein
VVGGARDGAYVRALPDEPSISVGALLEPGAGPALFGTPADVLANQHTPLDALWGSAASELLERLQEAATPEGRLEVLEGFLVARVQVAPSPVVSFAVSRLQLGWSVGRIVERTGYTHRHFLSLFRAEVGLGPKVYGRVVRFGRALDELVDGARTPAEIALAAGFSDQAHFAREFRELAGLTPGEYLDLSPRERHHVAVRSDFFKTAPREEAKVRRTLRSRRSPR